MQEQIEARLASLRSEFETGQKMLVDLEARQANLRLTLARISGAIQVLEELLAQDRQAAALPPHHTTQPPAAPQPAPDGAVAR